MAFHKDPKITGLVAIAGLLVSYTRLVLQYHQYSWDSVLQFLGWWFLHYIAVIIILGIAYAIFQGAFGSLLGRYLESNKLSMEQSMIYGSIVVIVAAISILILAHWIPPEALNGD